MWKEVEYSKHDGVVIIDCGYCLGREYVIAFVRMAPCVYMIADGTIKSLFDAPCHGGITYLGDRLPDWHNENILPDSHCTKVGKWVGWHYAHEGDCILDLYDEGHRYTIEEIRKDVYRMAQYLGVVR